MADRKKQQPTRAPEVAPDDGVQIDVSLSVPAWEVLEEEASRRGVPTDQLIDEAILAVFKPQS